MPWHIWIDRGGTFTDVIARRPDGDYSIVKLLSRDGAGDAALQGVRAVMGLPPDAPLPRKEIAEVRIGSTLATNALLERTGEPTFLVVNDGFADLLDIGHQARPHLFDLDIRKPPPLYARVGEVSARMDAAGSVLAPLDEPAAARLFAEARAAGLTSCAIALIHAWRHPDHERRLGELARAAGFHQISLSSAASPLVGLVSRAQTTVVDAYLTPVVAAHAARLADALDGVKLSFMTSNGALVPAALFRGKDALLSGPAGGAVGAAKAAAAAGFDRIIGFDMGGTSTDVSLYDGELERTFDAEIAGAALRTPMMAVHTIAAGGGSVLSFDGARMHVGPASAGADPGPRCYRRGGPLALTDANVMLGRIQPQHFPAVFGPNGDQPLDAEAVAQGFTDLAAGISAKTGAQQTVEAAAAGFLSIAVSSMARAIAQVAFERGHDPADFALQAFGGAAGQHACLVADELGVSTVLLHPFAGVLSAWGIGLAERGQTRRHAIEKALDKALEDASQTLDRLTRNAVGDLAGAEADLRIRRTADLRYADAEAALSVPFGPAPEMRAAFEAAHRARFGFATPDRPLILESCTAEVALAAAPAPPPAAPRGGPSPSPIDTIGLWSAGRRHSAPAFDRAHLRVDDRIDGPALIRDSVSTIIVEADWSARLAPDATLVLTRSHPLRRATADGTEADPVRLEVFANLFMAAAERMGAVLRSTSTSVNIRERLDFSCALFDAVGNLIANAPHVPVHLGAMGESVRAVLRTRGSALRPGDMIALNNPYRGGTHLPDVTVVAPVFDREGKVLRFFVANRGHHADIGGRTPGSTPPHSVRLEEEGVVIDDLLVVSQGEFREAALRRALSQAAWPARNPDANILDIRAQIAANQAGRGEMERLAERYSWSVVSAYMDHVRANAEESVRRVIDRLRDGAFEYPMDDGSRLCVAVAIDRAQRSARIDFTGTSDQRSGNFNAPPAVTRAAVLYVFRCLVHSDLPLNEGCLAPLEIVVPEGSFLAPRPGAAVVAGNTEVSQAVVNALLGALGVSAASQGTMNNLLLGNARFQYYETICGGAGAGPDFSGASAVHTHMTNTRITDPEELELRCPVRLERFAIRRGSGGDGRSRGGDGVERRIRLLEPATLSLVSSRRTAAPFGLAGGGDGAPGRQWIDRADGARKEIEGVAQAELEAGDAITVETPGGGGFGRR